MKRLFLLLNFLGLFLVGMPLASAAEEGEHNWDLFADFLVWRASEEPTSFWASIIRSKEPNFFVFEVKDIRFDWDFGFRVGIGYTMEYDEWDTQLYWTWFRTETSSKIPAESADITPEFFAGFIVGFANDDITISGKINWTIHYNMFDWELGRNFCISKFVSMRPFIGLKGGTINQTIRPKWENETILPVTPFSSKENVKNNFWGIGPSAGVNTKWKFVIFPNNFLYAFGDFSAGTLWGTWKIEDKYKDSRSREIPVNVQHSHFGALMLRGFFGVGWEFCFNQNRSRFSSKLGYEMQLWVSQLRLPTFQQLILHGDLTLQGGTFELRLDF